MTNYQKVLDQIHLSVIKSGRSLQEVSLVAVTKDRTADEIRKLYQEGCRQFGESKIQQFEMKKEVFPADISWHFIGHLQKNKVNKAIGNFTIIHSVDSLELAKKISEASQNRGLVTRILLQANTSGELSKHGLSQDEWHKVWPELMQLPSLQLEGLMTMAPLTENDREIHCTFSCLRHFKETLVKEFKQPLPHLSMGMSHDFPIAIEEGATLVRIGSALFGNF